MSKTLIAVSTVLATALLVIFVIYLTPLKHLNLVAPVTKDIDPTAFWKDYSVNPEKYMFIDVRSAGEYNELHAKGAVNIPIAELYEKHKDLPRHNKTIVLICTGGRLSGVAYGFLEHQGFLNLLRIHDGLKNWIIEGLPIEGTNTSTTTHPVSTLLPSEGTCPKTV